MESIKKPICTCCGEERKLDDYYASASPFHSNFGKLPVCKKCIWKYAEKDNGDLKIISNTLRMLDRPFQTDLWEATILESEKSKKETFKTYMKNLGLKQNRELTWEDSNFKNEEVNIDDFKKANSEITSEEMDYLKRFWGDGLDLNSYIRLQTEYEDWTNRYECDSKGMETLIQEICLTQLDIKTRRAKGEKVDAQLKTLQDLLGSSNLKPVQETGANAVEQESFGTLIKKFEKDKPIPEPDPAWKDVDGIAKYIKTFFFGHMAKAMGIENKYQDEYEDEIAKYTVEQDSEDGDKND